MIDLTLPAPAELAVMDHTELLTHLAQVADRLESVNTDQGTLWDHRRQVFAEARTRTPKVTLRELAAAAHLSEVGVISQLKKGAAKT